MNKIILFITSLLVGNCYANAQWDVSKSTDEMTGKISAYCSSQSVYSTKQMDFPYSNTQAWVGIGYDGKNEWIYIGFTNQPNLNNTDTEDGYNGISTRVKWDDNITTEYLTQTWGAKFIHFTNDKAVLQNIMKSHTLLLELDWHGNGKTYFKFDLRGSSEAIVKMRSICK